MKKSTTLATKLEARLAGLLPVTEARDEVMDELDTMLALAESGLGFSSKREFSEHLSEGTLLNVNVLSSRSLLIPCGEYLVSAIDDRQAVLVPTSEAVEIHKEAYSGHEILKNDLLNSWNSLERVVSERMLGQPEPQQAPPKSATTATSEPEDGTEDGTEKSKDEKSKDYATNLEELFSTMPITQAELAKGIGVAEPSIGRWMAPEGHPSHRTPTVRHILDIADMTGVGACSVLNMAINQLSGGTKKKGGNTKSGSGGGAAWGGE